MREILGVYWLVYSPLYCEYTGQYIILKYEILKLNFTMLPLSKDYISQYTPKGLYGLIVNEINEILRAEPN